VGDRPQSESLTECASPDSNPRFAAGDRALSDRSAHQGPEEAKSGTALIQVRGIECKPTVDDDAVFNRRTTSGILSGEHVTAKSTIGVARDVAGVAGRALRADISGDIANPRYGEKGEHPHMERRR
jgi:hypothetical protein